MKYKITLDTVGEKHEATGKTIGEALDKIVLDWHLVKNKATITVSQGKKKYSHLFYLKQFKMLCANKYNRLLWAKRLTTLLESV